MYNILLRKYPTVSVDNVHLMPQIAGWCNVSMNDARGCVT